VTGNISAAHETSPLC